MREPNWRDPRINAQARSAYEVLCENRNRARLNWSSRYLDQLLGDRSTNTGRWLRANMLIVVDPTYSITQGRTKAYRVNKNNLQFLALAIEGQAPPFSTWSQPAHGQQAQPAPAPIVVLPQLVSQITQRFHHELTTGNFQYRRDPRASGNTRWHHPLQTQPNNLRRQIFAQAGYQHNYDIQAAMLTVISQRAQQIDATIDIQAAVHYTQHRREIRQQIAQDIGRTEDEVKELIQAVVAGGTIRGDRYSSAGQAMGLTWDQARRFREHPEIVVLTARLRAIWRSLRTHIRPTPVLDERGRNRKLTPKERMRFYFQEETRILEATNDYFQRIQSTTGIRWFFEHDGFRTTQEINLCELREAIRLDTGYEITHEYEAQ